MTKKTGKSIAVVCAVVAFLSSMVVFVVSVGFASQEMHTFKKSDYAIITIPGEKTTRIENLTVQARRLNTQISRFDQNNASIFTLYQASFLPADSEQWKTEFYRYPLQLVEGTRNFSPGINKDNTWGEVGTKMQNDTRGGKLYTLSGDMLKSLASFTSTDLKDFWYTEENSGDMPARWDDFRTWLLEGPEGITPLGDMQDSNILYVRRESANEDDGDDHVYIQTNRGVLHQLDTSNGSESWGFIPPNIFEDRLKYLKFGLNNGVYSYNDGGSTPLNLLDGKLTAYPEKADSDYLIGTLGYGGNGVYAMKITSGDQRFLWAVENMCYSGDLTPSSNYVKRWGALESVAEASSDYSLLGLTVGEVPMRRLGDKDGKLGPIVGILPAGVADCTKMNYNFSEDIARWGPQGRAIYIISPDTGAIYKTITEIPYNAELDDLYELDQEPPMGMVVAPPTLMPVDDQNPDDNTLGYFYIGDSNGNVLFVQPEDPANPEGNWTVKCLTRLVFYDGGPAERGTRDHDFSPQAIPYRMLAVQRSSESNDLYLIGVTGSIYGPHDYYSSAKRKDAEALNNELAEKEHQKPAVVYNFKNNIFCLHLDRKNSAKKIFDTYITNSSEDKFYIYHIDNRTSKGLPRLETTEYKNPVRTITMEHFPYKTRNPKSGRFEDYDYNIPAVSTALERPKELGWRVRLKEETSGYYAEEPTLEPYLYGGLIWVATFKQSKTTSEDSYAYVYALHPETGRPQKKPVEYKNKLITSLTGVTDHMLVTGISFNKDLTLNTGTPFGPIQIAKFTNDGTENFFTAVITNFEPSEESRNVAFRDYWRRLSPEDIRRLDIH